MGHASFKSRMTVSTKILIGFGVVLVLHIAIALMNHVGLQRSQADFDRYSQMTADALVVEEITYNVGELQRNVLLFTYTGHAGSERRIRQQNTVLLELIRQAKGSGWHTDDATLDQMRSLLDNYIEQFDAVTLDRKRRIELTQSVMPSLERQMINDLNKIITRGAEEGDAGFEPSASASYQSVLLAFTAASHYREDPDSNFVRQVRTHLLQASAANERLMAELSGHELNQYAVDVMKLIPEYESAFLEMVQSTRSYLHLVNVVLAGEAAEFSRLAAELNSRTLAELDVLSAKIQAGSETYLLLSNIIALLTIAAGVIAASVIGRSIVPPLRAITDTLVSLARGSHEAQVPGLEREDEIGQMARAAQVFKEKSLQTEELLEQSQRLAGERNAANLKLEEEVAGRRLAQEELLSLNEELNQKNTEMEQFTYSASHDLKSPLVSCNALVNCVFEDLEKGDSEQVMDSMARIQRNIARMENCINDLLELSRVGRVRHEPETITAFQVLNDLVRDYQPRLGQVQANIQLDPDIPDVTADPIRFSELFDNLITNAMKYACHKPGNTIHVGGKLVENETHYYVRDEGPGIAEKYQKKVFGMFQRLEKKGDGSGIGLAIVVRIMELHGGRAWLESSEGQGATFWVAFPNKAVLLSNAQATDAA